MLPLSHKIALLLIRDNRDQYLTENKVHKIMNKLITYCKSEKDYRGYVEGKGWAHAAAHISDALELTRRHSRINFKHLTRCLMIRLSEKGLLGAENDLIRVERRFNPYIE